MQCRLLGKFSIPRVLETSSQVLRFRKISSMEQFKVLSTRLYHFYLVSYLNHIKFLGSWPILGQNSPQWRVQESSKVQGSVCKTFTSCLSCSVVTASTASFLRRSSTSFSSFSTSNSCEFWCWTGFPVTASLKWLPTVTEGEYSTSLQLTLLGCKKPAPCSDFSTRVTKKKTWKTQPQTQTPGGTISNPSTL